jgi:hypothetical protein
MKGTPLGTGSGPATRQIAVTRQITFVGCTVAVEKLPNGGRQLQIIDPGSATVYLATLEADNAREIGHALSSAVPIASPGDVNGAPS